MDIIEIEERILKEKIELIKELEVEFKKEKEAMGKNYEDLISRKSLERYLYNTDLIKITREKRLTLQTQLQQYYKNKGTYNIIKEIYGGLGLDGNMSAFGDYLDTINRMSIYLMNKGYAPPFTIISDSYTYEQARSVWHLQKCGISTESISANLISSKQFEINGKIQVYIGESDFIIAHKFIKEWIIDNSIKKDQNDYQLLLTKGKTAISTKRGLTLI